MRFRRVVALTTALLFLTSCETWRKQSAPPEVVLKNTSPFSVRVFLAGGTQEVVYGPAIDGDRLVGWTSRERPGTRNASHPLSEIKSMDVRATSAGKTAIVVVLAGATALVVAAAAAGGSQKVSTSGGQRFSCPLIYSATEDGWRLDSGTYGGAIMRPLRRADLDNLDFARPRDGVLTLKVANELDETDYVDAVEVLAVDHPTGTTVGPSPDGKIHVVGPLQSPVEGTDFAGRDILSRVRNADGLSWESALQMRDPDSAAAMDGIELKFKRLNNATSARLVVDAHNTPWSSFLLGEFVAAHGNQTAAWYSALEAEPARALQMQTALAHEAFLHVWVKTDGGWVDRGLLWEAGPEIVKRQVVPIDLTGVSGDAVHVRLSAPASFWLVDFVGLDTSVEPKFSVSTLALKRPETGAKGVVVKTLADADRQEHRLETGDSVELQFAVPAAAPQGQRAYMVRSTGWYRIHTPEDRAPDLALLDAVLKPGGVARVSAMRMNAALESLQLKPRRE